VLLALLPSTLFANTIFQRPEWFGEKIIRKIPKDMIPEREDTGSARSDNASYLKVQVKKKSISLY